MLDLSESETQEFQKILSYLYGDVALSWNINLRVLELLERLLRKSDFCSRSLDLVPRPFVVGGVIKWASKQARDVVLRHLRNQDKHYYACLKGAALSMRTRFELAAMGY